MLMSQASKGEYTKTIRFWQVSITHRKKKEMVRLKKYIIVTPKVRKKFCLLYNRDHSEESLLWQVILFLMFSPVLTSGSVQNTELNDRRFQGNKKEKDNVCIALGWLDSQAQLVSLPCWIRSKQSAEFGHARHKIENFSCKFQSICVFSCSLFRNCNPYYTV